jgi:medium-chain acyl-[acyl-carrier-protein] hydrolase
VADTDAPPRPWTLSAKRLATANLRLFCLPYAGGGASVYRPWVAPLSNAAVEVWPIQLPGRENRLAEPPYDDMCALVSRLADEFAPYLGPLPYAFFGHSVGASVGFELLREIRRRGLPGPRLLIVSAQRPPHRPAPDVPAHHLSRDQLVAKMRRYAGTAPELFEDRALIDLVLPTLRADLALVERGGWTPEEPLTCPIAVLGGSDDSTVRPAELPAWADLTSGPTRVELLPGDHFYFTANPPAAIDAVRRLLTTPAPARSAS